MLPNIFLIGPMASGKTTIGKQLAEQLGRTFYDTDKEIEARTGVNIPWIFDVEGEAGFRERETAVIKELTALPNIVLATGGGAVLSEVNRTLLSTRGYVIYLRASSKQQLLRTTRDQNRPLLQTADPYTTLENLHNKRDTLYQMIANWQCDTDGRSPHQVTREIMEHLNHANTLR